MVFRTRPITPSFCSFPGRPAIWCRPISIRTLCRCKALPAAFPANWASWEILIDPSLRERLVAQLEIAAKVDGAFAVHRDVEEGAPAICAHHLDHIGAFRLAAGDADHGREIIALLQLVQRAALPVDREFALVGGPGRLSGHAAPADQI